MGAVELLPRRTSAQISAVYSWNGVEKSRQVASRGHGYRFNKYVQKHSGRTWQPGRRHPKVCKRVQIWAPSCSNSSCIIWKRTERPYFQYSSTFHPSLIFFSFPLYESIPTSELEEVRMGSSLFHINNLPVTHGLIPFMYMPFWKR